MPDSPIDILYCLGGVYNGGQERQLYYLMNRIDKNKYMIALAVWRNDDSNELALSRFESLGVPIFKLEGGSFQKVKQLKNIVSKYKIKICHSYTFYINSAIWMACLFTKTKAIGGLRSSFNYFKSSAGIINGILCGLFPLTNITNNYIGAKELKVAYPAFFKRNIYTVTNGIELSKQDSNYSSVSKEFRVCAIGRLGPEKRWDILIEVVAALVQKGYKIKLKLAGDGLLKNDLQELISQKELQNNIILIGETKEISQLLQWSVLLIHTAESEGASNVIMEAMAAGRAVLATNAGDTSWLVDDRKTGYIVPINDTKGLIDKAIMLLESPAELIKMGKHGRLIAEQKFSVKKMMDNTFEIYKKEGVIFKNRNLQIVNTSNQDNAIS